MSISGISTTTSYDPFGGSARSGGAARAGGAGKTLTPDEEAQVKELKARDREVRAHEAAHMAAGAGLASGASYSYQRGPDGVNYAIGGEVRISTSPGRTPEETIERARQIRAAALAPADPSGQDYAVAAEAVSMEQQARTEMARESRGQGGGQSGETSGRESPAAGAETPAIAAYDASGGVRGAETGETGTRLNVFA